MYMYCKLTLLNDKRWEAGKDFQELGYKVYSKARFINREIKMEQQLLFLKREEINLEEILSHSFVRSAEIVDLEDSRGLVKMAKVDNQGRILLDPNDPEDRAWFED